MLLVIESREDLAAIPADTAPRSTEQALRAMGWPFPVDDAVPTPRRPLPVAARPSNVVPLKPAPAPVVTPVLPEPRRAARRALPLFGLELAEAH
jgi:hypothetical protein